jgi:hypothetical protein
VGYVKFVPFFVPLNEQHQSDFIMRVELTLDSAGAMQALVQFVAQQPGIRWVDPAVPPSPWETPEFLRALEQQASAVHPSEVLTEAEVRAHIEAKLAQL